MGTLSFELRRMSDRRVGGEEATDGRGRRHDVGDRRSSFSRSDKYQDRRGQERRISISESKSGYDHDKRRSSSFMSNEDVGYKKTVDAGYDRINMEATPSPTKRHPPFLVGLNISE